jgi:hypothetical protein
VSTRRSWALFAIPAPPPTTSTPIRINDLDDAARRDASHATVSVVQDGGRLVVTVDDDGTDRTATMVQLADRVGALDGKLDVKPRRLRAELPCA